MHQTEQAVLDILLGPQDTVARTSRQPPRRTLPAELVGTFVNGADTLTMFTRADSAFYRYLSGAPQPVRALDDGSVGILDALGNVEQTFRLVRGRSGERYLHDGLTAFRRTARARASGSAGRSTR